MTEIYLFRALELVPLFAILVLSGKVLEQIRRNRVDLDSLGSKHRRLSIVLRRVVYNFNRHLDNPGHVKDDENQDVTDFDVID